MSNVNVTTAEEQKPQKIKLQSMDGQVFEVAEDVACKSRVIEEMMDNICFDETVEALQIKKIDGKTLKKILEYFESAEYRSKYCDENVSYESHPEEAEFEYCEEYGSYESHPEEAEIEYCEEYGSYESYPEEASETQLTEYDKAYLNVDTEELFKIILAADYLDIPEIMDITAKQIAMLIEGKSTVEVRELFKVENDYTPEEEAEMREEYDFLQDQRHERYY